MELTAKAIREVEFREKLRGYHPEDVDAFVEEIAAGIDALEQRLRNGDQSGFSGAKGTSPAASDGGAAITEETLRRTLIMAQRTADLVLSDAQESAAGILSEARSEAEGLLAGSRSEAEALLAESKAQARKIAAETERQAKAAQHDVVADLARMEAVRDRLSDEIATLGDYLDTQRARIREALLEQLHVLDGARTQLEAPPTLAANGNGSGSSGGGPIGGSQRNIPSTPTNRGATGGSAEGGRPGSTRPSGSGEPDSPPTAQYGDKPAAEPAVSPADAEKNPSAAQKGQDSGNGTRESAGNPEARPGGDEPGTVNKPAASSDVDVFSRGRSPDDVFRHDGDGEDPFLAGLRKARDEPAKFDRPDTDVPLVADATNGDRSKMGNVPLAVRPDLDRGAASLDGDGPGGRLFRRN